MDPSHTCGVNLPQDHIHITESTLLAYAAGVPWAALVRHPAVIAAVLSQFSHNYFNYTCLSWLPKYLVEAVGRSHGRHDCQLLHRLVIVQLRGILVVRGVRIGRQKKK